MKCVLQQQADFEDNSVTVVVDITLPFVPTMGMRLFGVGPISDGSLVNAVDYHHRSDSCAEEPHMVVRVERAVYSSELDREDIISRGGSIYDV